MKKALVALATAALGHAACAQSSVTLYGVVDAALSHFSNSSRDPRGATPADPFYLNKGSARLSRTDLRNSGYNTSRLGFRGTEDLGGGWAAGFWLEAPIGNDDGSMGVAFTRRATVSLIGPFGELRLGRDHTPTYWNNSVFDPIGQVGVGANLLNSVGSISPGRDYQASTNYPRASNSIGYFLPPGLGGFYGQAMFSLHENTKYEPGTSTPPGLGATGALNTGTVPPTRAGRYAGARFGYASGPLDVAVAVGRDITGDRYYAGSTDPVKIASIGASYDFGPLKLFGEYAREAHERDYAVRPADGGTPTITISGYILGFTAPVGPGLVRASYGRVDYDMHRPSPSAQPDPRADKVAIGYVHNLSKRTALYATVARIRNRHGAALTINGGPAFINNATYRPDTATGYDLGIRHAF